jgi:hypothetical protein
MLPNGCYGSSLAFDQKSAACLACAHRKPCEQIVNDRYPKLMTLLARFTDTNGKRVAEHWLSAADKKRLKERKKLMAQREAETALFGSPAKAQQLRQEMSDEAAKLFDQIVSQRINPTTAPIDTLKTVSKPLGSALTALQRAPTDRTTIERAIASGASLSASTAQRETKAVLSLLKRCGRIAQTNNRLEIK